MKALLKHFGGRWVKIRGFPTSLNTDGILRLWVGWKLDVCSYIPNNFPNGHEAVRSGTEVVSKWLLRELKMAQDNYLASGLATFQTQCNH